MTIFQYKKQVLEFILCIVALFVILFLVKTFVTFGRTNDYRVISTSNITFEDEKTNINFAYPRFKSDKINKIVTDYVYEYVLEFKEFDSLSKVLDASYELYYFEGYVNIVFIIDNSLKGHSYKNIIIDLENEDMVYMSNIYDKDSLANEINSLVFEKYSFDIYNQIKELNVDNHTYIISDEKIDIYFYGILVENETPFVSIKLVSDAFEYDEGYVEGQKYIVFTFDDGPSEYTLPILDVLEEYESTATFFMLGNRMKYDEATVKKVFNSNSEVASHTYSHKDLTSLEINEAIEEINTANIIFNQITNDGVKYIRPPYGNYNDMILENINLPLVLWNVDSKDWLVRDSNKIYNNVINNACDGCIVLFHDSYEETYEAIKLLIPKLNELGYNVVSVSDLIKYRDGNLVNAKIINSIDISNEIVVGQ